jgi:thiamine biosynthesis lipoprotein
MIMHKPNPRASAWRPSRRDMFFLGIGGLVAAVPVARRQPLTVVRRHVLVMGTIAEFAVAHRDPAQAHSGIDAAIAALRDVDARMSRFLPSSDVGRANLGAARGPVAVTGPTITVLKESLSWAADSNGIFDPCLGRAIRLWDVSHRHEPPADAETSPLANRRLYRFMDIGDRGDEAVVRFRDEEVQIDLGGIAKGYGVDRAVDALRKHGIEHALVGAGGDLYALGRSPSGEAWHVGIQSPGDPASLAASVRLEDAAIATSGDYQQFFVHRNQRYHHLLDPATGAPRRTAQRSISVVAGTCMAADAGATLAFGRPAADVTPVLARHGAHVTHTI